MIKLLISNFEEVQQSADEIIKNNNIDILKIMQVLLVLQNHCGIDIETWKNVVNINLFGTFNCCRAIVPNMIKNNYGRSKCCISAGKMACNAMHIAQVKLEP